MRVLIACEYSGTVRDAFIALDKGHDAMSCDIIETESPGPHYKGDIRDVLYDAWDLVIAHPPCQYLSSSGLHWNNRVPGRLEKTAEAAAFFMLFTGLGCPTVIENPIGHMNTAYRKPDQYIRPQDYGHDASKKTGLWITGGLPPLIPDPMNYVDPRWVCCGEVIPEYLGKHGCPKCRGDEGPALPRWGNQTNSGQNKLGPSHDRAKNRAKSYSGWAKAMAEAWG